jgi:hypothetical protein
MHIPQTLPAASVIHISSVDITLHEVTGASWHILLPYTLFGVGLMVYSQTRLIYGQRVMKQQATNSGRKRVSKVSLLAASARANIWVVVNGFDIQRSR